MDSLYFGKELLIRININNVKCLPETLRSFYIFRHTTSTGYRIIFQLELSANIIYFNFRMKLFSLLKSSYYKPDWSYTVRGQLWRLLFSAGEDIVGEDRDTETKQTTYFCLNRTTGRVRWNGKTVGDPWWTTTEGIFGSRLYLHAFAKPDLPHPRHVTALDIETGRTLWSHPDYTFLYATADKVVVVNNKFEGTEFLILDPDTGEVREKTEQKERIEEEKLSVRINDPHALLDFPSFYRADNPDHIAVRSIMTGISKKYPLVEPVEFYVYGRNAILCYHKSEGKPTSGTNPLTHELSIYNTESGQLLYGDILYRNAPAPVPDGFMLRDNTLYYIKNKKEIVAISLHE
jgi:hypothetical protein